MHYARSTLVFLFIVIYDISKCVERGSSYFLCFYLSGLFVSYEEQLYNFVTIYIVMRIYSHLHKSLDSC